MPVNTSFEGVEEDLPIALSPITEAQLPLVYATWLESYRDSKHARSIRKNIYFNYQRLKIDAVLKERQAFVTKAHLADDSDCIFGYAVYEIMPDIKTLVLHYVFSKFKYRNLGIADRLVKDLKKTNLAKIFYYTHRNTADQYLFTIPWLEQTHGFVYNPYMF